MKNKPIWFHFLFWAGLYLFWVLVFQQREFAFARTATVEFCYLFFIMANYYFNARYTFPRFLYRKKYPGFIVLFVSGNVVAALLRVPLAAYLNHHYFMPGQVQPGAWTLFTHSVFNITLWTGFLLAVKTALERFRFQEQADLLAAQKKQAELDFLNAQFNPHFLFNSIHSIYGHIDKTNTTARNMLLTFSDMLRYQLYDCSHNTVPIEKETAYLKNYVALQKVRKEEHVRVDLQVAENVRGFSIAPLLFIAFIENSFKYVGNHEEKENRISISLETTGNILHFRCYNTREPGVAAAIEHKGIGLSNARRRLALLYPQKHKLDISETTEAFEVNLKIDLS